MSWTLTVMIGAGLMALGTLVLLITHQRARRSSACATVCAGVALLFAALARDRGDAAGLLVSWLILGVWGMLVIWSWQAKAADETQDDAHDREHQTP